MDIQIVEPITIKPFAIPSDEIFTISAITASLFYEGLCTIHPLSPFPAVHRWIQILQDCGIPLKLTDQTLYVIGAHRPHFSSQPLRIDIGDNTFLLRLSLGLFACHEHPIRIEAHESLQRRSMALLIEGLQQGGTHISSNRYYAPPLTIHPCHSFQPIQRHHPIPAFRLRFPLLLAARYGSEPSTITEPALRQLWDILLLPGTTLSLDSIDMRYCFITDPAVYLHRPSISLPADTLLSDFIALFGLLHPTPLSLPAQLLGTYHGSFVEFLLLSKQITTNVQPLSLEHINSGSMQFAELTITRSDLNLQPTTLPPSPYFHRQAIPFYTILCAATGYEFSLDNAVDLRQMQTDWIAALVDGLAGFGAIIDDTGEGLKLSPSELHGGAVDCANDETIALAFLALACAIGDNSWLYNVPNTFRIQFLLQQFAQQGFTTTVASSSSAVRVFNES